MKSATEHENEEEDTPGWLQLLLFPLMLVAYIRQIFADQVERTKAIRRTRGLRPDWQDFIPNLRHCEQLDAAIRAEGVRRILAGEPLDLDDLTTVAPDENDPWGAPTSAQQMHLRMLGLSRFHADPEHYIYRQAFRILRAAARATTTTIRVRNVRPERLTTTPTTAARTRAGMRVRAPPWRPRLPIPDCLLPRKPSFRDRPAVPARAAPNCQKFIHRSPLPSRSPVKSASQRISGRCCR